ncbi:hypothetical protein [Robertmurraya sp.]
MSLPFFNNKTFNYKNYLIKRVCRIYIPYLISIFISLV